MFLRFLSLVSPLLDCRPSASFYGDEVVFPTHVQPRGTKMWYLVNGSLNVILEAEFRSTSRSVNTFNHGQVSVFPIGLGHGQRCVSCHCEFVTHASLARPKYLFRQGISWNALYTPKEGEVVCFLRF
jgi:Cupin